MTDDYEAEFDKASADADEFAAALDSLLEDTEDG